MVDITIAVVGGGRSGRTSLASRLGKKGSESDIVLYNSSKGFVFVDSVGFPVSFKSLVSALNVSDAALLCIPPEGFDVKGGECIVALDMLGFREGVLVLTMADRLNPGTRAELESKVDAVVSGTLLEGWNRVAVSTTTFEGMDDLKERLGVLASRLRRRVDSGVRIDIDHFFNVRGVGCVALGLVKAGMLNVRDKLVLYPLERKVEVRSIQVNDVDVKSASAGTRVGVALKGVQAKELERGFILCGEDVEILLLREVEADCNVSAYSSGFKTGDVLHLFCGLQSTPVRVKSVSGGGGECHVVLSLEKEIAAAKGDRFLLAQLNNPKLRLVAWGRI